MLETSSFSRILELLDSVTTPEGRIPVIRIALMTARLNDADTALLKEKEIENLINRLLPDLLRKSLSHLQVASSVIYFNKNENSLNTQTNTTPHSFFQLCKITLFESFSSKIFFRSRLFLEIFHRIFVSNLCSFSYEIVATCMIG